MSTEPRTTCLEKKLATEVKQLQASYPEAEIQLWCEDELLGVKRSPYLLHNAKSGSIIDPLF